MPVDIEAPRPYDAEAARSWDRSFARGRPDVSGICTTTIQSLDRWFRSGVGLRARLGAPMAGLPGRSLPATRRET